MSTSTSHHYMDEAEALIREYASQNPHLAVWRLPWPMPGGCGTHQKFDTILVGRINETDPSRPSDKIFLSTFVIRDLACMTYEYENDRSVVGSPLSCGDETFEHLKGLARKLPLRN